jgi:diguanylate cyclase (GGDEF)-like protein/PAS domain S-box-containing protein
MKDWPRVLERAIESTRNGVLITDPNQPDNPIVYANPAFERITGYSPEEVIGRNCRFLQGSDRDQPALEEVRTAIREGRECRAVVRNYRKDGTLFWQELSIAPVRDEEGRLTHFVGIQDDVTERKLAEARLAHQAFHDPLTNLPNRVLFMDRLQEALSRAKRDRGAPVAVLFLDLDDFKKVNETLGYYAGDRVLAAVAGRVEEHLRDEDTAARLGGDEFMILLDGVGSAEDATRAAEKILEGLQRPLAYEEREFAVTASIGIVLSSAAPENDRPRDFLRFAEVAMYRSKREGMARYAVFQPGG